MTIRERIQGSARYIVTGEVWGERVVLGYCPTREEADNTVQNFARIYSFASDMRVEGNPLFNQGALDAVNRDLAAGGCRLIA